MGCYIGVQIFTQIPPVNKKCKEVYIKLLLGLGLGLGLVVRVIVRLGFLNYCKVIINCGGGGNF